MQSCVGESKLNLPLPEDLYARLDNEDYELISQGIVTTTVDKVINWGRKNSIWPMAFGLACCAIEMMAMTATTTKIVIQPRREMSLSRILLSPVQCVFQNTVYISILAEQGYRWVSE